LLRKITFLLKQFAIDSTQSPFRRLINYLNADMRKFESSQSEKSRVKSFDS